MKMKNIKMFGKTVPLLAIVLVGLMTLGASAYLVDYLSNQVTAEVTVTSPMTQEISLNPKNQNSWTVDLIELDARGGETVTLFTRTENLADAVIEGTGENIIKSAGITLDDFTLVRARTSSDGELPTDLDPWYELTGTMVEDDVHFAYGPAPITWDAGQVDITEIELTFASAALGTYTFTSRIIPVTP